MSARAAFRSGAWGALVATALSGCAISAGYRPGPANAEIGPDDRVLVVVTEATVGSDAAGRRRFWAGVAQVEASFPDQPGLLGHTKRTEVFGARSWTMTVWRDEESLTAFVAGAPHQQAIASAYGDLTSARFARIWVSRSETPISWERALALLDAQNSETAAAAEPAAPP